MRRLPHLRAPFSAVSSQPLAAASACTCGGARPASRISGGLKQPPVTRGGPASGRRGRMAWGPGRGWARHRERAAPAGPGGRNGGATPPVGGSGCADRHDHFGDEHDVSAGDIGAQHLLPLSPAVHLLGQRLGLPGQFAQLGSGRERAGQPLGQRLAAAVDHADEVVTVDRPWVAIVAQRGLQVADVTGQRVPRQFAQQVFLIVVAPVQGADADTGPVRDGRDRRVWIGEEDFARGVEDAPVIACGFAAASAQRTVRCPHGSKDSTGTERSILLD